MVMRAILGGGGGGGGGGGLCEVAENRLVLNVEK